MAAISNFVYYQYAISIVVMTFRRGSDIFYIPPGQSRLGKGLPYSLITLLLGWWGFPWGPIYSIGSIYTNFGGGKIVTSEIFESLCPPSGAAAVPSTRMAGSETGFTVPEER